MTPYQRCQRPCCSLFIGPQSKQVIRHEEGQIASVLTAFETLTVSLSNSLCLSASLSVYVHAHQIREPVEGCRVGRAIIILAIVIPALPQAWRDMVHWFTNTQGFKKKLYHLVFFFLFCSSGLVSACLQPTWINWIWQAHDENRE